MVMLVLVTLGVGMALLFSSSYSFAPPRNHPFHLVSGSSSGQPSVGQRRSL